MSRLVPAESHVTYGECRVFGPDGVTLLRVIPAGELRRRTSPIPDVHAPVIGERALLYPIVPAVTRRQVAAKNLTKRNKAKESSQ